METNTAGRVVMPAGREALAPLEYTLEARMATP
jgi:hypothetical protein